ncbi:TPA: hypothetical protein ACRMWT_000428 [Pseudomonas aeruginosa]
MNKANECTCPSGDGSLVHPCPAHPAVEQAGGDRWDALQSIMEWTAAKNIPDDRKLCLIRNAARAALAQPSPVRSSLLINGYQLRAALDFIAPDGTAEQLESEACIEWRQQDADFLEAGLYAFCAEYPEEGGVLLDEEPTTAQPSPLQSEQANAGYDQLWAWFGLSRSAYAVLPRVMMHAMPDDWQRRFAELMDEWDDHWPNQPDINARVHITQNGLYISTPKWLLDYRHPDHNQLNAMRGKDEL